MQVNDSFSYVSPMLKGLEYRLNDGFKQQPEQNEVNMKLKFNVVIHEDKNLPEADVDLTCEIGGKEADYPYYLCVTETSKFRWLEELDKEKVKQLLEFNAPALLLSFLRSIVLQVTVASPCGAFHIPFIDFTKR